MIRLQDHYIKLLLSRLHFNIVVKSLCWVKWGHTKFSASFAKLISNIFEPSALHAKEAFSSVLEDRCWVKRSHTQWKNTKQNSEQCHFYHHSSQYKRLLIRDRSPCTVAGRDFTDVSNCDTVLKRAGLEKTFSTAEAAASGRNKYFCCPHFLISKP